MNKRRWRNPEMPIEVIALKLAEEVGEVAKEITDLWVEEDDAAGSLAFRRKMTLTDKDRIATELDHVAFLFTVLRSRIADLTN